MVEGRMRWKGSWATSKDALVCPRDHTLTEERPGNTRSRFPEKSRKIEAVEEVGGGSS